MYDMTPRKQKKQKGIYKMVISALVSTLDRFIKLFSFICIHSQFDFCIDDK